MKETENKALYIAEQCRKAGMTLAGAAGVLANVEAESVFKSDNLQDTYERALGYTDESYTAAVDNGSYPNFTGDAAGFGLAQWTASDRKAKMLAYFKNRKVSIGDFKTQVDFLLAEMKDYSRAWSVCVSSDKAYNCGYAVCKFYEIPANTEAQSQHRGNRAEHWYSFLTQHQGESGTVPTGGAGIPAASVGVEIAPVGEPVIIPATESFPPRMIDNEHCEGWPEIWLAQSLLKCRAYNVTLDGIFGKRMTDKVKEFQTHQQLDADGVIGKKTWVALGIRM